MTGRRSLCGGKGAIDFCIHPDFALNKGVAHIPAKGGPEAVFKKKSFKNRKIQNIMMTWTVQCVRDDKKLCANEVQNFALNPNKEIPPKTVLIFHVFIAYRNMILEPYPPHPRRL